MNELYEILNLLILIIVSYHILVFFIFILTICSIKILIDYLKDK
jgi:hypothetical protein